MVAKSKYPFKRQIVNSVLHYEIHNFLTPVLNIVYKRTLCVLKAIFNFLCCTLLLNIYIKICIKQQPR